MRTYSNPIPAVAVPPGETLRNELAERGLSQAAFAQQIGRPVQAVNEIIKGKKSITAETAIAFEKALGASAEMWLNLESGYQLAKAREAARAKQLKAHASPRAGGRAGPLVGVRRLPAKARPA
jgi:HTH-type transcriptional regulator/antitoxin HigA